MEPYHLHVPVFFKSVILNLLAPSGPVQACNGVALPVWTNQLTIPVLSPEILTVLSELRKYTVATVGPVAQSV